LKNLKIIKSKNGMTLVEVVASVAILALLAVFVVSIFATSITIVGRNAQVKKSNTKAAAGIENTVAGFTVSEETVSVIETSSNFEIVFGGNTINKEGTYYKSSDEKGEGNYYYFVPNS
jgi:prepilin-type N-terminal cleavage/methylation domain-containing protein